MLITNEPAVLCLDSLVQYQPPYRNILFFFNKAFEILREEQGGEIDTSSDGFHSLRVWNTPYYY